MVKRGSVHFPALCDRADREAVLETQAKEVYATQGVFTLLGGQALLTLCGASHHPSGPLAVEDTRQRVIGDRLLVELHLGRRALFTPSGSARLGAAGYVPYDSEEKRSESSWASRVSALECSVLSVAFDEHFLSRVVDLGEEVRATPSGGEVRANDPGVALRKEGSLVGIARPGSANHDPAGGL